MDYNNYKSYKNVFLLLLLIVILHVPGSQAASPEVVGLAVAGSASFVLMFLIIFMVAISTSWSDWMTQWMRSRGKVKMPKAYWKKKEAMKRRLLAAASSHGSLANGGLAPQLDRASYVQGWNQRSNAYNGVYEEKDVAVEFGPEQDDEFKIETVICDDEVLDVGPYSGGAAAAGEVPVAGPVYSDPYMYSTAERRPDASGSDAAAAPQQDAASGGGGGSGGDGPPDITIANFEENLVKL